MTAMLQRKKASFFGAQKVALDGEDRHRVVDGESRRLREIEEGNL